jgi:DNA repair protein RadC
MMAMFDVTMQPRERMIESGPQGLTDVELLALVVGASSRGSGGVLKTCRELLARFHGLDGLGRCGAGALMQVPGIGAARACALAAVIELARRLESSRSTRRGRGIRCSADVYARVKGRLSLLDQELFLSLALDAKHKVLTIDRVAQGSATSVEVHPREVFGAVVRQGAAAVIVAHNHPSGEPEPSQQDRELTERLVRSGEILGIPLLDHLVVGARSYVSFADRGWI